HGIGAWLPTGGCVGRSQSSPGCTKPSPHTEGPIAIVVVVVDDVVLVVDVVDLVVEEVAFRFGVVDVDVVVERVDWPVVVVRPVCGSVLVLVVVETRQINLASSCARRTTLVHLLRRRPRQRAVDVADLPAQAVAIAALQATGHMSTG